MTKLIQSIPTEGLSYGTHIDVELSYSKNEYGNHPRGYYLHATPVRRNGVSISYIATSCESRLIMKTNRYSQKQFDKALEMCHEHIPALTRRVMEKERAAA